MRALGPESSTNHESLFQRSARSPQSCDGHSPQPPAGSQDRKRRCYHSPSHPDNHRPSRVGPAPARPRSSKPDHSAVAAGTRHIRSRRCVSPASLCEVGHPNQCSTRQLSQFSRHPIRPEARYICGARSRPVRCGFSRTGIQRHAHECQATQLDHSDRSSRAVSLSPRRNK